ncbi:MAG: M14 family metallopeptidase [Balneolaceae bacterium]
MRHILLISLSFLVFIPITGHSQVSINYYLPDDIQYNPEIPTPEEVIGHQIGEWHITHDKLVQYMYAVAESSERVTIEEYARTHENRPLLLLTITSERNQENIDRIKENQIALTYPERSQSLDISRMPVIVNLGYSVHGNEPSGSNAAPLITYYLAAAQGEDIDNLLHNAVILIDPSLNPDGLQRFSTWVNMHKSHTINPDPADREYNEVWPGGRTNHYWFDLNRDWMPVQHPESRGRITKFHEWKPNVLTDFHEMGTNTTYFFQPGVPSRTHPLTPQRNQDLTMAIAEYHADALNEIQSLYYTRERFDDFYYGKGSTYPDVNGSVGILFEQASSRGHAQESIHGVLEFPFTIRNQVTTTFSTLKASLELREELLEYMRFFYREAVQEASRSQVKAFLFGDETDKGKTWHLVDMLNHHDIDIYELSRDIEIDGKSFRSESSFIVPMDQRQFRFIKAMFEQRTSFTDSLFYDVSTWTLPHAFNLQFAELDSRKYNRNLLGNLIEDPQFPQGEVIGGRSNYAYLFEWSEYYAPRALYRLQKAGIRTKVASVPFKAITGRGLKDFGYGTILISLGIQGDHISDNEIFRIVQEIAREDGINVYNMSTGLVPEGIDLGSPSFQNIDKPKVAVLAGSGVRNTEVGEIWHLFDQRYKIPLTILEKDRIGRTGLNRYNVIVMPNGGYGDLSDNAVSELKMWVSGGGTLITQQSAVSWANRNGLANIEFVREDNDDTAEPEIIPYVQLSDTRGAQVIGGSIFHGKIDYTNPVGYGYKSDEIKLFRSNTLFMKKAKNPFATPVYYTDSPLASGYISGENLEKLRGTASVIVSGRGSGRVINFIDNPNFRGFWFGTNKMFMNAVFFGNTISAGAAN